MCSVEKSRKFPNDKKYIIPSSVSSSSSKSSKTATINMVRVCIRKKKCSNLIFPYHQLHPWEDHLHKEEHHHVFPVSAHDMDGIKVSCTFQQPLNDSNHAPFTEQKGFLGISLWASSWVISWLTVWVAWKGTITRWYPNSIVAFILVFPFWSEWDWIRDW